MTRKHTHRLIALHASVSSVIILSLVLLTVITGLQIVMIYRVV